MRRALLVASLLAVPALASADVGEARRLFEQGTAELTAGRFPEARDLLRRSLEEHPHPATVFNLIVALRGTEEPVEASRLCEDLLGGRYGALDAAREREARVVCDEVASARGRLTITVSGAPRIALTVDALSLGELDDGATVERFVDPGWHVLRASAPDRAPAERSIEVARGASLSASLELAPPAGGSDAVPWAVGLGVGGAVLVGIAIAIVAAVVLAPGLPAHDHAIEI